MWPEHAVYQHARDLRGDDVVGHAERRGRVVVRVREEVEKGAVHAREIYSMLAAVLEPRGCDLRE